MSSKKSPLISIIIPTFNSGATLSVALDSIFFQTFKDFEVLIIDGLSTDNTRDVVSRYKNKFSRIHFYSENDKGIYDAMNKGIALATGEWLYFMGSDDSFYEPTTLEKFINNEAIVNTEVVYGNVFSTYFNGSYDGLFNYSKLMNQNICHQSIFFRNSVFSKTGNYNLKYKAYADWNHNINWFFKSDICNVYIDQVIANFTYGGFSSIYDDKAFKNDKIFLLISKGIGKLTLAELLRSCNNYINYVKQEGNVSLLVLAYALKVGLILLMKDTWLK